MSSPRPPEARPAGREGLLTVLELVGGVGMLASFLVVLFVPALGRFVVELPWMLGGLQAPAFGINPHHVAGARHVPSLLVVVACGVLLVCYRWLASRRRN